MAPYRASSSHDDFRYLIFLFGKESEAAKLMDCDLDEAMMDERDMLQHIAEEIRRGGTLEMKLLHALCRVYYDKLSPADIRMVSNTLKEIVKQTTGENLQASINKDDWWPEAVDKLYGHAQKTKVTDENLRCLLKAAAIINYKAEEIEKHVEGHIQAGDPWFGAWSPTLPMFGTPG